MTGLDKNTHYLDDIEATNTRVQQELRIGLKLLKSIEQPIITIFGSHVVKPGDHYYDHANETAKALAKTGHAIVTGGGPGIMQAANSGALEEGMPSIGFQAKLLRKEQVPEEVHTHAIPFEFLFVRRFLLALKSEALIFYPGGYGTLNELFEYLVLMETRITDKVPVICVGKEYWEGLITWLHTGLVKRKYTPGGTGDIDLINIVDSVDDVLANIP